MLFKMRILLNRQNRSILLAYSLKGYTERVQHPIQIRIVLCLCQFSVLQQISPLQRFEIRFSTFAMLHLMGAVTIIFMFINKHTHVFVVVYKLRKVHTFFIRILSDVGRRPYVFCLFPPSSSPSFPARPPPGTRSLSPPLNLLSKSLSPAKLEPSRALFSPKSTSSSVLDKSRHADALLPCPLAKKACKLDKSPTATPKLLKLEANSFINDEFSKELVFEE